MSHIDSFKHEIVGLWGGLPVYHPLQEINGDFTCTPEHLLIGGGSGEHPALVIDKPINAVAFFLNQELKLLKKPDLTHEYPLVKILNEWYPRFKSYIPGKPDDILAFYEWDEKTFENFVKMSVSPGMPNPLDKDAFEHELICSIGEFVFFAMPDLAADIMEQLSNPYAEFCHIYYNNILAIPPNMPVYANGGNAFRFERANSKF